MRCEEKKKFCIWYISTQNHLQGPHRLINLNSSYTSIRWTWIWHEFNKLNTVCSGSSDLELYSILKTLFVFFVVLFSNKRAAKRNSRNRKERKKKKETRIAHYGFISIVEKQRRRIIITFKKKKTKDEDEERAHFSLWNWCARDDREKKKVTVIRRHQKKFCGFFLVRFEFILITLQIFLFSN